MKHIFKVSKGKIKLRNNFNGFNNLIKYIHNQCDIEVEDESEINKILDNFINCSDYLNYTRGKYLLWFLIEFCLSVCKDYEDIEYINLNKKPKLKVSFSHTNALVLIAPRCRMPESIKKFMENTVCKYVKFKNFYIDRI
jgi:rRNA pseudouridine-1189 N-methylase Emg1 (Nep1/Mra1 family)